MIRLKKQLRQFKQKMNEMNVTPETQPKIILKMWMPNGISPPYNGGRVRIIASNSEDVAVSN